MASEQVPISRDSYLVVSCIFCTLAIVAAAGRTFIRHKHQQLRWIDDSLFLIACLACIVCTVLQLLGAPKLYALFTADPSRMGPVPPKFINDHLEAIQPYSYSFAVTCFLSICCVKLSYLAFFARLVDRQRILTIYWRFITAIVILTTPFIVFSLFIGCSEFGANAYKCSTQPQHLQRMEAVMVYINVLDIFTDLLIASIPILLLYQVNLKVHQKIGLASFLCLSLVMIVIAIVRVSTTKWTMYLIWASSWAQVEACLAIIMLSTTAFRQLFVGHSRAAPRQEEPALIDKLRRSSPAGSKSTVSMETGRRPFISPPVLQMGPTGIQTTINGNPTWLSDLDTAQDVSLARLCEVKRHDITIRHHMYAPFEPTASNRVSVV